MIRPACLAFLSSAPSSLKRLGSPIRCVKNALTVSSQDRYFIAENLSNLLECWPLVDLRAPAVLHEIVQARADLWIQLGTQATADDTIVVHIQREASRADERGTDDTYILDVCQINEENGQL